MALLSIKESHPSAEIAQCCNAISMQNFVPRFQGIGENPSKSQKKRRERLTLQDTEPRNAEPIGHSRVLLIVQRGHFRIR
jgi:hypothetical protein